MAERPTQHARHDMELVPGCVECDALAPDFATITASLASLRGGTQTSHRDFRLTREDAARLRRGRGLRAWLRPLAGAGFAFARPLGSALTVVALVGLVASNLSGVPAGGQAIEAVNLATHGRQVATDPPPAAPQASGDMAFGSASRTPEADGSDGLAVVPTTKEPTETAAPVATNGPTDGSAAPNGIFLASLVLLPIGLLLLFGRGLARRLVGPTREP